MNTIKVIHKYQLNPRIKLQHLNLPIHTEILHVGNQFEQIQLWVSIIPGHDETESRKFLIVTTGENFEGGQVKFIGTVILAGGGRIFHVFEVLTK